MLGPGAEEKKKLCEVVFDWSTLLLTMKVGFMTSCDIDTLHRLRLEQELSTVSLDTPLEAMDSSKFDRGPNQEPNKHC